MADVSPLPKPVRRLSGGKGTRRIRSAAPEPELNWEVLRSAVPEGESELAGVVQAACRPGGRQQLRRLRRGGCPVEEDLDLHRFTQEEALRELEIFLRESSRLGLSCVLVVHGKGKNSPDRQPTLKNKVPEWLLGRPCARYVEAFATAMPRDGGAGALYVLLRKSPDEAGRKEGAQRRRR